MQLGKAEALGVFDNHNRGLRHIDADLDNGGGDKDRETAYVNAAMTRSVVAQEPSMHMADALAEAGVEARRNALPPRRYRAPPTRDERTDPIDLRGAVTARDPGDDFVKSVRAERCGLRSVFVPAGFSSSRAIRPCRRSS